MENKIKKLKRCSICRKPLWTTEEAELLFGAIMHKSNISVHYYCLLLSTNLPQRGRDSSGINGFLLQDIRREIDAAGKRRCAYCSEFGASICCHVCKIYFDTQCGHRNGCLFVYTDDFKSYCEECIPQEIVHSEAKSNWHLKKCHICMESLGAQYSPVITLFAPCCKNGFFHQICIQKYAMSAGYYLRCIFCKNTSFRKKIPYQGVFVPDREARWESLTAFLDLHRGHKRCDMEQCLNPKGREHETTARWKLINCTLCGSFGAHYECLPRSKSGTICAEEDFKCEICANTERNVTAYQTNAEHSIEDDVIDNTVFVQKQSNMNEKAAQQSETPTFTDEENSPTLKINSDLSNTVQVQCVEHNKPNMDTVNSSSNDFVIACKRIRIECDSIPCETFELLNVSNAAAIQSTDLPSFPRAVINLDTDDISYPSDEYNTMPAATLNSREVVTDCIDLQEATNPVSDELICPSDESHSVPCEAPNPTETLIQYTEATAVLNPMHIERLVPPNEVNSMPREVAVLPECNNSQAALMQHVDAPEIINTMPAEILYSPNEADSMPCEIVKSLTALTECIHSQQALNPVAGILNPSNEPISMPAEILNSTATLTAMFEETFNLRTVPNSVSHETENVTKISNQPKAINATEITNQNSCDTVSSPKAFTQKETAPLEESSQCDYVEFDMYEFTHDHEILGTCKLRLNMNSPRFKGKSIQEIQSTPGLILEKDIIQRTNDIGIFRQINSYLDSVINSLAS